MPRALREVVYRLLLKEQARPPAVVLGMVPELAGLEVEMAATNLDGRGNVWRLVQVRGPKPHLDQVRRAFLRHRLPTLLERKVVGEGRGQLVLWYRYKPSSDERGPSLTKLAFDRLGPETVVTDRTTAQGLEVRILANAGRGLRRFLAELQATAEEKHAFTLVYVGPPRVARAVHLTPDEHAALEAVRAAGYFAVPRKVGLAGVAKGLGCSASALSYRLRRAEAKLLEAYFGG